MPSPGVRMPTIRSPGTAPPSGAKRTGRSPLRPRIGIGRSRGLRRFRRRRETRECGICRFATRERPNQPSLRGACSRACARPAIRDAPPSPRRRLSSRRGRPPRTRPRPKRARGAAARLRSRSPTNGFAARAKARSIILRPRPAYCVRTADARRAADRGARLAGDGERFPCRRRRLSLAADDLDLVAVLQFGDAAARPCR